ncbi:MAG: 3'-5' exonuclease [Pseudomonadota bacterium]
MSLTAPERWPLRLRVFLFFLLLGLGGAAMVAVGMVVAARRLEAADYAPFVLGGGGAVFGILLLTAWVWQLFDENLARPIQRLSGELMARGGRGRATADAGTLPLEGTRYLGPLGPAAAQVASELARARSGASGMVQDAVVAVEAERAELAAVLRDLREAVVLCNPDDAILLYNREAQRLLSPGAGSADTLGLDRPLFALLTEAPVRHALERLRRRFESGRYLTHRDHLSVAVVTSTRDGSRTLDGRLALVLDAAETDVAGYALTLRDATAAIAGETARDRLLADGLTRLRRPAANLGAAAELMAHDADMDTQDRTRFAGILGEEARKLAGEIDALAAEHDALRPRGAAMNDVSTAAIAACLRDRCSREEETPEIVDGAGVAEAPEAPPLWMHCDSHGVVELLAHLSNRLRAAGAGTITLAAEGAPTGPRLDLEHDGAPVGEAVLEAWLTEPLAIHPTLGGPPVPAGVSTDLSAEVQAETGGAPLAAAGLTGADVLAHHRSALWSEPAGAGRARLRLPMPPAVEDHASGPAAMPERPEFYDFSLRTAVPAPERADARLDRLTFVVFDTETTGLFPTAGDAIVQIGAVRVVNARVLGGETFEQLVDPGRRIPAAATRVHGITDEMVAGQPGPGPVLRAFHDYCAGAVLVAHNAPFDMAFLARAEGASGRRFDNAVLDTVLLSALLFGQAADHRLDALAERFALDFEDGGRHTALSDARVTAHVLAAMIPALETMGVTRLDDAITRSEAASALRRRQARV